MSELKALTIDQIALTERAKFEYWLQDKWNVLPTDPRYTDLTEEQLDLLYAHYARLNPPEPNEDNDGKARDADYDSEAELVEGYDPEQAKAEGRLPIQDFEHFEDPDFDAEWNAVDEETDSDIIGENLPSEPSEAFGEGETAPTKSGINLDDSSEWKEV